jgi:hypothetical protein
MRYAILLALVLTCCTPAPKPSTMADNTPPAGPVIARLVSRHNTITIRAGAEPTYQVESQTGIVVVKNAPLKLIAQTNPEWSDRIKAMQDNVLWAGMDAGY